MSKACINCTKSKQRCDEQLPCERCRRKRLSCYLASPPNGQQAGSREHGRRDIQNPQQQTLGTGNSNEVSRLASDSQASPLSPPLGHVSLTDAESIRSLNGQMDEHLLQRPEVSPCYSYGECMAGTCAPDLTNEPSIPISEAIDLEYTPDSIWCPSFWPFLDESISMFSSSLDADMPDGLPSNVIGGSYSQGHTPTPSSQSNLLANEMHFDRPGSDGLSASHNIHRDSEEDAALHRLRFPSITPEEKDLVHSEEYYHVQYISSDAYQYLAEFYSDQWRNTSEKPAFLSPDLINVFIQLFFEHFDAAMPLLHRPTFKPSQETWILLLSMAAIGCQFSGIRHRIKFTIALQELLHRAVRIKV